MEERLPKLRIKHVKAKDWRAVPASGVRAGLTSDGHIFISPYCELVDDPVELVRDQGAPSDPSPARDEIATTREIFFTAVMRPEVAEAVARLLLKTVQKLGGAQPALEMDEENT